MNPSEAVLCKGCKWMSHTEQAHSFIGNKLRFIEVPICTHPENILGKNIDPISGDVVYQECRTVNSGCNCKFREEAKDES